MHEADLVGQIHGLGHVVCDKQHGGAVLMAFGAMKLLGLEPWMLSNEVGHS